MGRNGGHERGDSMAAYGELSMATVITTEPRRGAPAVVRQHTPAVHSAECGDRRG